VQNSQEGSQSQSQALATPSLIYIFRVIMRGNYNGSDGPSSPSPSPSPPTIVVEIIIIVLTIRRITSCHGPETLAAIRAQTFAVNYVDSIDSRAGDRDWD